MTSLDGLPPDLAAMVRRETAGETILSVQQTAPKDAFRAHIGGLLIGVPWLCFMLLWESLALDLFPLRALGFDPVGVSALSSRGEMLFMAAFGFIFVLIGLAMIWTPFGWARHARHSALVVTERHVRLISTKLIVHVELTKVAIDRIKRIDVSQRGKRFSDMKLVTYSHTNSDGEEIETAMELKTVAGAPAIEALIRSQMVVSSALSQ